MTSRAGASSTGAPGCRQLAADIGCYLEHLVETEGRALATVRLRLAAIAAAHRLGGHEDPTTRPLVKATMKRLAREYGKPRKQANGLTSEALAAVKATARIQRVDQGKRWRKETEVQRPDVQQRTWPSWRPCWQSGPMRR